MIAIVLSLAVLLPQAALDSPSPRERREAIEALGVLGNKDGIVPLADALKRESRTDLRIAITQALGTIRDAGVVSPLIEVLRSDPERQVRLEAIHGILRLYIPTEQAGRIRGFLTRIRETFFERDRIMTDPGTAVDPAATAALAESLQKNFDHEVRMEAARALGSLRAESQIAAMTSVLEDPRNRDQVNVRREIIGSLGAIRNPEAGPALERALRDRNRQIAEMAAESLGQVAYIPARPALESVFRNQTDRGLRTKALAALSLMRDRESAPLFLSLLDSKDDVFREIAVEGLARTDHDAADFQKRLAAEKHEGVRVALAYGLAGAGRNEYFTDLVTALGGRQASQAETYLYELAKLDGKIAEIHRYVRTGSPAIRSRLARIMGAVADPSSRPFVEQMIDDPDTDVAREAVSALRQLNRTP